MSNRGTYQFENKETRNLILEALIDNGYNAWSKGIKQIAWNDERLSEEALNSIISGGVNSDSSGTGNLGTGIAQGIVNTNYLDPEGDGIFVRSENENNMGYSFPDAYETLPQSSIANQQAVQSMTEEEKQAIIDNPVQAGYTKNPTPGIEGTAIGLYIPEEEEEDSVIGDQSTADRIEEERNSTVYGLPDDLKELGLTLALGTMGDFDFTAPTPAGEGSTGASIVGAIVEGFSEGFLNKAEEALTAKQGLNKFYNQLVPQAEMIYGVDFIQRDDNGEPIIDEKTGYPKLGNAFENIDYETALKYAQQEGLQEIELMIEQYDKLSEAGYLGGDDSTSDSVFAQALVGMFDDDTDTDSDDDS